jgi:hypothetical protein
MDQLGIYPQYYFTPTEIQKNTTLHEFENALAHMTALVYWAGIYIFKF